MTNGFLFSLFHVIESQFTSMKVYLNLNDRITKIMTNLFFVDNLFAFLFWETYLEISAV